METNNLFIQLLMIATFSLALFCKCSSTRSPSETTTNSRTSSIHNMIDSRQFTFVAETVYPLRGSSRTLTSSYDVVVNKDSIISLLPYFGRASTASLNTSESGIKFTSASFSYDVTQSKNNRWGIVIKPQDKHDVQQMDFEIYENGKTTLNVISTSRDPISFTGYIKDL
ncbi:MAG: DUF4251 domain-containing protein [Ginsengibacter sp.]